MQNVFTRLMKIGAVVLRNPCVILLTNKQTIRATCAGSREPRYDKSIISLTQRQTHRRTRLNSITLLACSDAGNNNTAYYKDYFSPAMLTILVYSDYGCDHSAWVFIGVYRKRERTTWKSLDSNYCKTALKFYFSFEILKIKHQKFREMPSYYVNVSRV